MNLALVEDPNEATECWYEETGLDPYSSWPEVREGLPVNQAAAEDSVDTGPCKESEWQAAKVHPTGKQRRPLRRPINFHGLCWVSSAMLILAFLAARIEAVPATLLSHPVPRVSAPCRHGAEKTLPPTSAGEAAGLEFALYQSYSAPVCTEYHAPGKRGGMPIHKGTLIQSDSYTEILLKHFAAEQAPKPLQLIDQSTSARLSPGFPHASLLDPKVDFHVPGRDLLGDGVRLDETCSSSRPLKFYPRSRPALVSTWKREILTGEASGGIPPLAPCLCPSTQRSLRPCFTHLPERRCTLTMRNYVVTAEDYIPPSMLERSDTTGASYAMQARVPTPTKLTLSHYKRFIRSTIAFTRGSPQRD